MQKITPFLWFNDDAEDAVRFYCSIFKDSHVLAESRWGEGGPVPKGTLMTARFQIGGLELMAFNGGSHYKLNEAFSLMIPCDTQQEIDDLWTKLTADGGEPGPCGWLKDKFGLSWQVVPAELGKMMADEDPAKTRRVTEAVLQMTKLDLARLRKAYEGR